MSDTNRPEAFNIASHALGTVLAIAGLIYLLLQAQSGLAFGAYCIYGSSLILLLAASTFFHAVPHDASIYRMMQRVDHISIFALIAGTYTPPCLLSVPPIWGWPTLGLVWTIGIVGSLLVMFRPIRSRAVAVGLYVAMGWAVVIVFPALIEHVALTGIIYLAAGGVIYTVGAVIYGSNRPDPWPSWFGAHGLWHVLVLAGGALHFVFIAVYVPNS